LHLELLVKLLLVSLECDIISTTLYVVSVGVHTSLFCPPRARHDLFPSAREHAAIRFHPRPPSAAPNPPPDPCARNARPLRFLHPQPPQSAAFPSTAAIHRAKAAATPLRPQRPQPRRLAQLLFPRMEGGGWRWRAPSIPANACGSPKQHGTRMGRRCADGKDALLPIWSAILAHLPSTTPHRPRQPLPTYKNIR
jgi:hypothetical protein